MEKDLPLQIQQQQEILPGSAKMSSAEFEELIKNHLPDHPGDYKTVMDRSGFQYKNIIAAIKDICLGIEYCYGTNYGAKPYLTKSRKLEVETKIIEIQSSGPAPSFDEVKTIVRDEMSAQQINAYNIAKQLSCAPVIKFFGEPAPEPSDDYVRRLLQDLEMHLVRPSGLTSDQFESVTQSNMLYWFNTLFTEKFVKQFGANYFYNMDELGIDLDSSVKLIRISDNSRAIGVIEDTMQGHISMAVTVGPGAFTPPPVFILSKECKLPEKVKEMWSEGYIDIIQNDSGYQTLDTYDEYADCFIEFINGLRFTQRLNPFAPVCLAVDSHSSRGSATANRKFKQHNIISITFPPFLTFCMQPADVGINHSLRANFRKNLQAIWRQYELAKRTTALTQEEKVIAMVSAGRDAHQSSTTRIARENTFRGTGLFPRSPETLFLNKYIQNDSLQPKYPTGRPQKRKTVAGKILTSDETLAWLDERAERRRVRLLRKKK